MKKLHRIILIVAFSICTIFGFAACKEEETILLKAELATATVYEGQGLNLADGVLHYQIGDEKSQISLASSDVSVFGFDTNKLGEQTITVEYNGKTITLTVTVKPRMSVESAQTVYFVDEAFNKTEGNVKIVTDDGTMNVPLSDERITVEGFNSEATNNALALKVNYNDGETTYSGTFTVKVIDADVSLKKPNKLAYKSHDEKLDLSGGYLSVKANGKTDYVQLTQDMVSGFDPDALTIANRGKSVMQTISVSYKNRTFTYQVEVTYSNVSIVRYFASTLETLDFSGEEAPAITEEQGENALDAVSVYMSMEDEDKALITEKEVTSIVRPAAIYGYDNWLEEAKQYQKTFTISNNTVLLTCESYETTKVDCQKLQDTSAKIYTLGDILAKMATTFTEEEVLETKVSDYLAAVYSATALENCKQALEFMITLHECLKDVPADWTAEDLETYKSNFNAALEEIRFSSFKKYEERFVYRLVSAWREKDDYFDLMYTYFYNTDNDEAIAKLKDVALPGELEELYTSIVDAVWQTSYLSQLQVIDTTEFMVLFNNAVDLIKEVTSLEDGNMLKDLYQTLKFDGILQQNGQGISVSFEDLYDFVRTTSYGYMHHLHTIWETDLYEKLWAPYLAIMTNETEGYFESEQYTQDVQALFKTFVELRPTEQYAFLDSLNAYYRFTMEDIVLALETKDGIAYSNFSVIIANCFNEVLGEDLYPLYQKLVYAMEYYVLRFEYSNAKDLFEDYRYEAKAEYESLEPEQQERFDAVLGYFYKKYVTDYNETFVELDETWSAKFEELATAYRDAYDAYVLITGGGQENAITIDAYSLFFASYKQAVKLAAEITASENEDVLKVYYYQSYSLNEDWKNYSMDNWALVFKSIYASFMTNITLRTTSGDSLILWDIYSTETYNLDEFLVGAYNLLRGYRNHANGGFDNLTVAEVLTVMQNYRELSLQKKVIFSYLDSSSNFYHLALKAFFEKVLESSACEGVVNQILEVEKAYFSYQDHINAKEEDEIDSKYQEEFEKAVESMKQKFTSLTDAEKEEFNAVLQSVYEYYVAEYDALQQSNETEN